MIPKAKAVLTDIRTFEMAVTETKEYSKYLARGIACIEALQQGIKECINSLADSLDKLGTAKRQLKTKRVELENILNELRAKLNRLQAELTSLQAELMTTPRFISDTDENGKTIHYPNPDYESLKDDIEGVRDRINDVKMEMAPYKEKLERLNNLEVRIDAKAERIKSVVHSFEEQKTECKTILRQLEDIKRNNEINGTIASDSLKKLQKVILKYKGIKMKYDSRELPFIDLSVNINVAVNVANVISGQNSDIESDLLDDPDTEDNKIIYDADGHVCEYNGRAFGGRYNSYQARLDATSKPDPILGWYEGERGESKYIPSGRNAEGIAVAEILKKYGLNGIVYRNAEPDFEDCSEAVVTIPHMTDDRDINFPQADVELAKQWNDIEKDGRRNWRPDDVVLYRKAYFLSWHEKCDTKTMVLVRSEINLYFKHIGGVSECRMRDAGGEIGSEFDE